MGATTAENDHVNFLLSLAQNFIESAEQGGEVRLSSWNSLLSHIDQEVA